MVLSIVLIEYQSDCYSPISHRAKRILEQTEIHLLLTMNPDGYEVAVEGECSPDENKLGRLNANLKDLNHEFPEPLKRERLEARQREPEAMNVINWTIANKFILSLNFFAGEVISLYPYFTVVEYTYGYSLFMRLQFTN